MSAERFIFKRWKATSGLRMIEAHPIFVMGIWRFKAVVPRYNPKILTLSDRSSIAHDTFLQIGAEEGAPVLLLFLAMTGVAFRNCRAVRRHPGTRLTAIGFATELSLIGISATALSITVEFLPFCIPMFFSENRREIVLGTPRWLNLLRRRTIRLGPRENSCR
jgi:O-antigen ligase